MSRATANDDDDSDDDNDDDDDDDDDYHNSVPERYRSGTGACFFCIIGFI